jgi:hypothetical protein
VTATITVGAEGPNAGAALIVPVKMEGADVLLALNHEQRKALKIASIQQTRAATLAPLGSPEFRELVGDVAVPYAAGLLDDADLLAANIASIALQDGAQ